MAADVASSSQEAALVAGGGVQSALGEDAVEFMLGGGFQQGHRLMFMDHEQMERTLVRVMEAAEGPGPNTAKSMALLGEVLFTKKKFAEAETVLRKALDMIGNVPAASAPKDMSETTRRLMRVLTAVYKSQERMPEYEAMLKRLVGPDSDEEESVDLASIMQALGVVALRNQSPIEAERYFRRSEELFRKLGHPDKAIGVKGNLAFALGEIGRVQECEAMLRECLTECEKLFGQEDENTAVIRNEIAEFLRRHGREAEGAQWLLEGIEARLRAGGASLTETDVMALLGPVRELMTAEKFEDADTRVRQLITLVESGARKEGDTHPLMGTLLFLNGVCLFQQGQHNLYTARVFGRSVDALVAVSSELHPDVPVALRMQAACLAAAGRNNDASSKTRRADNIAKRIAANAAESAAATHQIEGSGSPSLGSLSNEHGSDRRRCSYAQCPDRSVESHPGEFKACGQCRQMAYCSKDCQKADWKAGHKARCQPGATSPTGARSAGAGAGASR